MSEPFKRWGAEPIALYCDDARHARGKVAEIGSVIVVPPKPGRWTFTGPERGARRDRPPSTFDREGRASGSFSCPLCPRRPALAGETLQCAFDSFAAAGVSRVSLALLDRYASQVASGEGRP